MGSRLSGRSGVGYRKDKEDVVNNQKIDRIFYPGDGGGRAQGKRKGWNKAVSMRTAGQKTSLEEEEE